MLLTGKIDRSHSLAPFFTIANSTVKITAEVLCCGRFHLQQAVTSCIVLELGDDIARCEDGKHCGITAIFKKAAKKHLPKGDGFDEPDSGHEDEPADDVSDKRAFQTCCRWFLHCQQCGETPEEMKLSLRNNEDG